MRTTIKSKKLNRTFEFWAPSNGGYITLEEGENVGCLGKQICEGGEFLGETLYSTANENTFKKICRSWYKALLRKDA